MRIAFVVFYFVAILVLGGIIAARSARRGDAKVYVPGVSAALDQSPEIKWKRIVRNFAVPAKPRGLWTCAYDYVAGPALLRVEVSVHGKQWYFAESGSSTADGSATASLFGSRCLLPSAPVGTLIVKVGGSNAGAADSTFIRAAGSYAVIWIDQNTRGPVFLSINDDPREMDDNFGELDVDLALGEVPKDQQASSNSGTPKENGAKGKTEGPGQTLSPQ